MITYIFRKRAATVFSIEKIFEMLSSQVQRSGLRVCRIELPFVSTGLLSVFRNARFVACDRPGGILHITGDVHYAGLLCWFSRTIVTVHDCVVLQRATGLKKLGMQALWFWLPLRLASIVTVISEQTKAEVLRAVAIRPEKIVVIPNFVDPAFEFTERAFHSDKPRILHVGTTPNKNLSKVAAALLGVPCTLVIVGPLTPSVRQELAANQIDYEHFVGVDHAEVSRLYQEADIVSFPSTYEGFGMPILEGQAVGRAVLTSNLEPMRDVAGEGGALLVDPHSVAAIRSGFLSLIRDGDLRARLIAAGLENCKHYSLENVTARYMVLYEQLERR